MTGYTTTTTLIETVDTLLHKRGGYMSNDIMPPWVLLDNVPNWEFGALTQIRDLARAMRNDFSRSQTQSTEDPDLAEADPLFHYDNSRWIPPDTEGRYRKGAEALERYLMRLTSTTNPDAQFFARADNLTDWLAVVEKRLGSLSQRLSASVGQVRLNTDLSGDATARQKGLEVRAPLGDLHLAVRSGRARRRGDDERQGQGRHQRYRREDGGSTPCHPLDALIPGRAVHRAAPERVEWPEPASLLRLVDPTHDAADVAAAVRRRLVALVQPAADSAVEVLVVVYW